MSELIVLKDEHAQHDWMSNLRTGVHLLSQLVEEGRINEEEARHLEAVVKNYKFRVSRYYLSLINWKDPNCPIRRQAIPSADELVISNHEMTDPTGDDTHRVTPLLIHRYPDRVLLTPTLNCPMYCRYCFRKVGLNNDSLEFSKHWRSTLDYLVAHPEIEEIILSGGDPLLLGDAQLARILLELSEVVGLRRLRIHSRVPVTLPQRLTPSLIDILSRHSPIVLVSHFNHPKELTATALDRLRALRFGGVTLSNQSVLLKGINDDPDVLKSLGISLVENGVIPHYLHHPDLTIGTDYLRVSLDRGLNIYRQLRGKMSGIAIPVYVMEIPGGGGKVVVDSSDVHRVADGQWKLRSPLSNHWSVWLEPSETKVQSLEEDVGGNVDSGG